MELADFFLMFPDLEGQYGAPYCQIWLNLANETVSSDAFGAGTNAYKSAIGYLAAHYIVIDDSAMAASQTVGGMTIQYGNGEDNSDLSLTVYGRIYMRMCRMFGAGGLVV